jgi:hypothetical protein
MKIGIVAIAIMIVSSILFGMFYKPPMETCITKSYFDSLKDMLIPFGFVLLMVLFAGMGGSDIYDDYQNRKPK